MALADITVNGTLDEVNNIVVPNNDSTWDDYTSWDAWTSWIGSPADPLVWLTDVIDLGVEGTFNLEIETDADGTVSYSVFTSSEGTFSGEETQTDIASGDTSVSSFSGRYVIVAVYVTADSSINIIRGISLKANNRTIALKFNDVDTSTLAGTNTARVLSSDRAISGIVNMQITPKAVDAYDVDMYVSNTPTSTTVIPKIVDKSALTFALVGIDNQPRDAVVDIVVEALPLQYMDGNNLRSA